MKLCRFLRASSFQEAYENLTQTRGFRPNANSQAGSGSAVCQQRLGCLPAAARLFAGSGSAVCQQRLGCLPAAARMFAGSGSADCRAAARLFVSHLVTSHTKALARACTRARTHAYARARTHRFLSGAERPVDPALVHTGQTGRAGRFIPSHVYVSNGSGRGAAVTGEMGRARG